MNCWVGIPFNMLLLVSGLTSISPDVYESASMDGANWGQRFLFITLPLMKESILAVLMLGFIYTFRAFDLMYIMTAGGPLNSTDVLGTYSYMLSFTQFNFSKRCGSCNGTVCMPVPYWSVLSETVIKRRGGRLIWII